MAILTREEILSHNSQKQDSRYKGPTNYKVGEKNYEVAPWNHPASLARTILAWVIHTIFYGVYIVAPMGHGKSTIAQTIAHFVHLIAAKGILVNGILVKYNFRVVWAGAHEFTHQREFFESLPKRIPHIIIFDDISGALKQLKESEMEKQFSTLTVVRDIIDPGVKQTPVICIVVGHYSKNLEKEFRAQLGMSIYASFGNEELTNLDSIAKKGTDAYLTLNTFADLYGGMFDNHKFTLYLPNGSPRTYITDHPFRACASITKTGGRITLFSKFDVCDVCKKKHVIRLVPSKIVYDMIKEKYGRAGIQALQMAMFQEGYINALDKNLSGAMTFITKDVNPIYSYDKQEMLEFIWSEKHKPVPKRSYTKRAMNNQIISILDKNSLIFDQEDQDKQGKVNLNEAFLDSPGPSTQETKEITNTSTEIEQ